ncbi:MAG TPA: coproporphyrinogen dehydrogenase HemZ [Firmicutes bacterium]|nr:coproporphyrinogen dehydrogenase HemZ [Bacillota bacterium]
MSPMLWRYNKFFVPVFFVCLIAIGTVSKLPDLNLGFQLFRGQDKLFHFLEYALLAFVGNIAFRFISRRRIKLFLFALLFIALDELFQGYIPGRNPDFWDGVAGVLPFAALFFLRFPLPYTSLDVTGYEENKAFELARSVIPGKTFTHGTRKGDITVILTEEHVTYTYLGRTLFIHNVDQKWTDRGHFIKRDLYDSLCLIHDKVLSPWGLLFQTRPHKVMKYLPEEERFSTLQTLFRVMPEKIALMEDVYDVEKKVKEQVEKTTGLYIGIPFCPSKCSYCSFTSYSKVKFNRYYEPFVRALFKELQFRLPRLAAPVSMIYIGGGTPFTLEDDDMKRLFEILFTLIDKSRLLEFTVEAGRPEIFTEKKCSLLRENGVGRIAVNPQTLHTSTLRRIGRQSTPEDFFRAYEMAFSAGFETINADIIFGLPGEMISHHKKTLKALLSLEGINNITLHALAPKKGAVMPMNESKNIKSPEKSFDYAEKALKQNYFFPYYLYKQRHIAGNLENIGYSRKGKESLYNVAMIGELCDIAGFGAGASTKIIDEKRVNTSKNAKDLALYIKSVEGMNGKN